MNFWTGGSSFFMMYQNRELVLLLSDYYPIFSDSLLPVSLDSVLGRGQEALGEGREEEKRDTVALLSPLKRTALLESKTNEV